MLAWCHEGRKGASGRLDMHVHAWIYGGMRTTIEIDDAKLAKLRQIAALRGKRGYSEVIDEALDRYLADIDRETEAERAARIARVLDVHGIWSDEVAEAVRARIKEDRKHWR